MTMSIVKLVKEETSEAKKASVDDDAPDYLKELVDMFNLVLEQTDYELKAKTLGKFYVLWLVVLRKLVTDKKEKYIHPVEAYFPTAFKNVFTPIQTAGIPVTEKPRDSSRNRAKGSLGDISNNPEGVPEEGENTPELQQIVMQAYIPYTDTSYAHLSFPYMPGVVS